MARPVLVVGDVQPDISFQLPRPGEPAERDRHGPVVGGGGTAANTAVGLARLGVAVGFVGAVGDDPFGRLVLAELRDSGIETSGCVVVPYVPTPIVFALAQPEGETALYRWPRDEGADWELRPSDIKPEAVRSCAWLHATGICLRRSPAREALLSAMRLAQESGIPVSFDLNFRAEQGHDDPGLTKGLTEAIALSTVLLGHGEEELMRFSGEATVEAAVRSLAGSGRTVIARLGARGVSVRSPLGAWTAPGYPTTVASTVGAGDAFNAGFIAASVAGRDLRTAVQWGQAVAALKIAAGGARALPGPRELAAFLAARG